MAACLCPLCAETSSPCCLQPKRIGNAISWDSIVRVSLYCLYRSSSIQPQRKLYSIEDIFYFIESHWVRLCINRTKDCLWKKSVSNALCFCSNLFESKNGFWGLVQLIDPWNETQEMMIETPTILPQQRPNLPPPLVLPMAQKERIKRHLTDDYTAENNQPKQPTTKRMMINEQQRQQQQQSTIPMMIIAEEPISDFELDQLISSTTLFSRSIHHTRNEISPMMQTVLTSFKSLKPKH